VLFLPVKLNDVFGVLLFLNFAALFEKGMLHAFIYRESEIGVEYENLMQKVDGLCTCTWIHRLQIYTFTLRECVEVLEGLLISHKTYVFFIWRADNLENDCQLIIFREGEPCTLLLDMFFRGKREARFPREKRLSL